MLATIALGAAQVEFHIHKPYPSPYKFYFDVSCIDHVSFPLQSPWGVAGGAIAGHFLATLIAIIGGALLANYISEKLVIQRVFPSTR